MPDPLLQVDRLSKRWGAKVALDGVSLTLARGATLGLVGGSGSGKSTLARCIARFERPDSGSVLVDGRADYGPRDVQLIFQEAAASLNPRFTAEERSRSKRSRSRERFARVSFKPFISDFPWF